MLSSAKLRSKPDYRKLPSDLTRLKTMKKKNISNKNATFCIILVVLSWKNLVQIIHVELLMSISLQVKFPPLQGFLHVNCSRLFLLRVSKLLYVGFIRFRSRTIPLFYWVPDSWRHECLSREGRVQQQVLQGLKRLRQESEIFNSWARQYHIEFFYPSQKVT